MEEESYQMLTDRSHNIMIRTDTQPVSLEPRTEEQAVCYELRKPPVLSRP
jgi:hypothetical protein